MLSLGDLTCSRSWSVSWKHLSPWHTWHTYISHWRPFHMCWQSAPLSAPKPHSFLFSCCCRSCVIWIRCFNEEIKKICMVLWSTSLFLCILSATYAYNLYISSFSALWELCPSYWFQCGILVTRWLQVSLKGILSTHSLFQSPKQSSNRFSDFITTPRLQKMKISCKINSVRL